MALPWENYLAGGTRTAARAVSKGTPFTAEDVGVEQKRHRGLLENVFRYIDLPGATVRSILSGDFGKAARNLGAFALPGIIEQPEEQPDFGFWGNMALDPLMYLTGGGMGAVKAFSKATRALTRSRDIFKFGGAAIRRTATKRGRKALSPYLDEMARATEGALPGMAPGQIGPLTTGAIKARRGAVKMMERLRQDPTKYLQRLEKRGLLERGGLKAGLPFTEGRTILGAGKNISPFMLSPFYWGGKLAGKQLGKVAAFRKAGKAVHRAWRAGLSKLYPGIHMEDAGRSLVMGQANQGRLLTGQHHGELDDIFKTFSPEARSDFTKVLKRDMGMDEFATRYGDGRVRHEVPRPRRPGRARPVRALHGEAPAGLHRPRDVCA
jgi:hypothetical protein